MARRLKLLFLRQTVLQSNCFWDRFSCCVAYLSILLFTTRLVSQFIHFSYSQHMQTKEIFPNLSLYLRNALLCAHQLLGFVSLFQKFSTSLLARNILGNQYNNIVLLRLQFPNYPHYMISSFWCYIYSRHILAHWIICWQAGFSVFLVCSCSSLHAFSLNSHGYYSF